MKELNFKIWMEGSNDNFYKKVDRKFLTQKTDVGKLLGFSKKLKKIKQGSFATIYEHPEDNNKIIKITAHKSDVYNLAKSQKLNSDNIVKLFDWNDKEKIKKIPELKSYAIIVENIIGKHMIYSTGEFFSLSLDGDFDTAAEWLDYEGKEIQKEIMEKYNKNNVKEHQKLSDLFKTLSKLEKYYRIELSDFQDNIIDDGKRYVIVDMGY